MADASPMIDRLVGEPELAGLRVTFEPELVATLTALFAGMERAEPSKG
jgi:hypothetical protein